LFFHNIKNYERTIYFQRIQLVLVLDNNYELTNLFYFGNVTEKNKNEIVPLSHLALFTFSLMNCKNAILINNTPPNKLQKKRIKRGELPLVQYKTISVDGSLLTINDQRLKNQKSDPVMPFHIVRGNFAVYNDKPLFGKYFGNFWRSQHSRGSKDLGIIVKDYFIQEPKI